MTEPLSDLPVVERTGVLVGDPAWTRERDTALGALTTVGSPTLAPLVRCTASGDAHSLTHLVPIDAVDLATLRARVPLRPGHVATVLAAVLAALDGVHRAHLAHGGVAPERVLVAPDGSVVLAGCGLAWAVPPGCVDGPTPADDVADVAALAGRLLGHGSASPALVLALVRAADPDPALRPGAADLEAAVRSAVAPEPLLDLLWLASARPAAVAPVPTDSAASTPTATRAAPEEPPRRTSLPRPVARRRRGLPRAVVWAAVLALPLVAAAALRLPGRAVAEGPAPATSAGPTASERPTASSGPTASPLPTANAGATTSASPVPEVVAPAPPDVDWALVLASLDGVRHRAILAGSRTALAAAVDPRGSAWADDAALADRVRTGAATIVGGGLVRSSVAVVSSTGDRTVLRVVDVRSAYAVTQSGTTTRVPARGRRTWEVTLVRAGQRWRIAAVTAVAREGQ